MEAHPLNASGATPPEDAASQTLADGTTTLTLTVDAGAAGLRLDQWVAQAEGVVSRSRAKALISDRAVLLDGMPVRDASRKVRPGEAFTIRLAPAEPYDLRPQDIPLAVTYEDAHLIVIDKPAGMVVHPAAGHPDGTLVNALLAHCGDALSGIGGAKRPGIVHRLDKDTSGLMVVAKTDVAHQGLSEQFAAHGRDGRLKRVYDAFVWGALPPDCHTIDQPIARAPHTRLKMAVARNPEAGKRAVTHTQTQRVYHSHDGRPLVSHLSCRLETGRTHQIRVHLSAAGHPLLGDPVYGAGFAASVRTLGEHAKAVMEGITRQALHARTLGFEHPVDGRPLAWESPLPNDLARLVSGLERDERQARVREPRN